MQELGIKGLENFLEKLDKVEYTFSLTSEDYPSYTDSLDIEKKENVREIVYTTKSENGAIIFILDKNIYMISPPFPVTETRLSEGFDNSVLEQILSTDYKIGIILIRLGKYAVGTIKGKKLIDSKSGSRYVKGKHKKGGFSQQRFQRIREEQIKELFNEVCEKSKEKIDEDVEFIYMGGDKNTLKSFLNHCSYLENYKTFGRILDVKHPIKKTLENIWKEIWKFKLFEFRL